MKLVSQTQRGLASQPLPSNLSGDGEKSAQQYTKWLEYSSQKFNELAQRWQPSISRIERNQDPVSAQKPLMEMNHVLWCTLS